MATQVQLHSGSPLIGNPITFKATAETVSASASFHRMVFIVHAGFTSYDTYEFSTPVQSGEVVTMDIHTALQAAFSAHTYDPTQMQQPVLKFYIEVYDEWMLNGNVNESAHVLIGRTNPPQQNPYIALNGAYSDYERLFGGVYSKRVYDICRKPTSSPQVVYVGDTLILPTLYTRPKGEPVGYMLGEVIPYGQRSSSFLVVNEGLYIAGDALIYALPAAKRPQKGYYEFRFINSLGALDSINVTSMAEREANIESEHHVRAMQETFNTFSRGAMTKKNDYETYKMSSGPVTEDWQQWFVHEFLMATEVWMKVGTLWLPVHIEPEETIPLAGDNDRNMCEVSFSVRLDINGSVSDAITV